jgi:pimeloyl-ACP methyl ester carboxylesterase
MKSDFDPESADGPRSPEAIHDKDVSPSDEQTRTHRWLRTAFRAAGALAILGGGGVAVHAILTRREKKLLKPPGRMIEVSGHMMHLLGTGTGSPTVVLETGTAGYFGIWEWVQHEVGKHTRVVSYDRAGLGFSEKTRGPRDGVSVARELDELLSRAGENPPYILLGHSFGGLLVMEYAHLYPEKTAGLVLADSHHPDQMTRSYELRKSSENFRRFFHTAAAASHFGVMRVADLLSSMTEGLSHNERTRARMFFVSNRHLKASARELDGLNETAEHARSIKDFGAIPMLILSAGEPQVGWVTELQNLHVEMARLSTRGSHQIIRGAEHLNIITRRENAEHVSRAILELVRRCGGPDSGDKYS